MASLRVLDIGRVTVTFNSSLSDSVTVEVLTYSDPTETVEFRNKVANKVRIPAPVSLTLVRRLCRIIRKLYSNETKNTIQYDSLCADWRNRLSFECILPYILPYTR